MKLLEKVCRELGVEIGEEWLGSDGAIYKFDNKGYLHVQCEDETNIWTGFTWEATTPTIPKILRGEIKPVWEPEKGERYYTPYFATSFGNNIIVDMWENNHADNSLLEKGLVFKTREEAIGVANKMLEAIKE